MRAMHGAKRTLFCILASVMDPKSPLVRVRDDGTIEPLTRRSEMLFKARPGLQHVAAPSEDVLLFRRIASENDAGRRILLAGEMGRRGTLGHVLKTVIEAGWTGELVVSEGLTHRSLFIREASIIGAASNALNERIGAVMTRLGVIEPEQLKVVVTKLAAGRRFGEVAVDEGFLTREKLFDVVRKQAEDIVVGALSVEEGTFAFLEGIDPSKIPARCHLDAREALAVAQERLAPAVVAGVDSIEEPLAWFNAAFGAIVTAAKKAGKLGPVKASLEAFADESPLDRAVFARMSPEGALDPRTTAEVLATLGVADPHITLSKRLYEYLVYALFVACSELPKDAERALLGQVEAPMAALTPRPPPVAPVPATTRPALQRTSTAPIARVALRRIPSHPALAHAIVDANPISVPPPVIVAPKVESPPEPTAVDTSVPRVLDKPALKKPVSSPEPPQLEILGEVEPEGEADESPTPPVRKTGTAVLLVAALLIAGVVGVSVLQLPVGKRWMAKFRPPPGASPIATPAPSPTPSLVVFAPASVSAAPSASAAPSEVASTSATPSASAAPSASAKVYAGLGAIRTKGEGHHRVWIDGKLAGETPNVFETPCGNHVVRIGSAGQPQMVEVPCGEELVLEHK